MAKSDQPSALVLLSFCTWALKKSFDNLAEGTFDKLVSHVMLTRSFWQMLCCIMSLCILNGCAAANVRGIAFDVNSYTLTNQCCLLNKVSPVWCWRFHWFLLSFWIHLFWKTWCHQIAISCNLNLCVVAFTNMKLISAIFPENYFCCTGFVWYSDNYSLLCMLWFHHDLLGCSSLWSVYFKIHGLINVCIQSLFYCVKPVVEEIITFEFNVLWGNVCLLWCSVFYTLRVRTVYLLYS